MSKAVRPLLHQAASRLRESGVASPDQEARQLLAYAAGVELARLPLLDAVEDGQAANFQKLINKRAQPSAAAAPDGSGSLSIPGT